MIIVFFPSFSKIQHGELVCQAYSMYMSAANQYPAACPSFLDSEAP